MTASPTPSPDAPLTGGCNCGAVRFEVTAPLVGAGWCHCTRCQRRTGTGGSLSALTAPGAFAFVQGAEHVEAWRPEDGWPKAFCRRCGSHLIAGDPSSAEDGVGVRFGAFDEDPGVRPGFRQYVRSSPAWENIPDDGLPRFDGPRPD